MKSSVFSVLVSGALVAFLTACGGDSDSSSGGGTSGPTTVFASTEVSVIPDDGAILGDPSSPLLSEINATNAVEAITKVTVGLNIVHTYDEDLDIFLVSPAGTRVELSTANGLGEDNYTNTVFDDNATDLIVDGFAPFTGTYVPEELLVKLNDENATGIWTLEITDTYAQEDSGTLLSWDMTIN